MAPCFSLSGLVSKRLIELQRSGVSVLWLLEAIDLTPDV
jgi:hypothetical protein